MKCLELYIQRIMRNKKSILISIILVFLAISIGTSLGSSSVNIFHTINIIGHNIFKFDLIESIDLNDVEIIWSLRLPRVILAFLVGGALAISGATIQSILKNQLASPFTLGVSSGASLGAGIIIVSGMTIPFLGKFSLPLVGFIFGIITLYIIVFFSSKVDKVMSNNTIILTGMVFSIFVNSILTLIAAIFSDKIKSIAIWQMGSFALKGWASVSILAPFIVIGVFGIIIYTKEMDILTFGEDEAKSIGVDSKRVKRNLFLMTGILTGSAVALSGPIGFVDLIAPHIVRRVFGSKHKLVIPMSFLFGGCLMIFTDLISRTLLPNSELPVGAVTAIFGAPFFAYIYFRKSK